ncbi:MAG: hypothetical protein ACREJO_03505 [Phycisphaerales bacterium]
MASVLQVWVTELSLMQQSVLIAAVRGPDGIKKDHVAKVLCRFLRRSFLISAFEGHALLSPDEPGGGSFTGPCSWPGGITAALDEYLRCVDELPHHFQLHLMHAAEILGYKHPNPMVGEWWHSCYLRLVNDLHLQPESEAVMDKRLGDREGDWRSAEEVVAR